MDIEHFFLGNILVELGFITEDQLHQCVKDQEAMLKPPLLGDLLVSRGIISPESLERALAIQKERLNSNPDSVLFGQLALERKMIDQRKLGECIRDQIRSNRHGVRVHIGQVMLSKGYLSPEQFLELVNGQKKELRRCVSCELYLVVDPATSMENCKSCGGTVVKIKTPAEITEAISRVPRPPSTGVIVRAVTSLGKYQIINEIGRGGMAIVYKAKDTVLRRYVALKVIRQESDNLVLVRRLHKEAVVASRLHHPNIVTIYEVDEVDGVHYLSMDYIDGMELQDYIARKKPETRDVLRLFVKICRAIDFANKNGVVHRDIKPSNIIVKEDGEPVITDFGLAKSTEQDLSLTREGTAMGTPYYMAPEQVTGSIDQIDARTDVYALGAVLYELVGGISPFVGKSAMDIYQKILSSMPQKLSTRMKIEPELESIIFKAIEKEPIMRYQTAGELADDIERFLKGEPVFAARGSTMRTLRYRFKKFRKEILFAGVLGAVVLISVILVPKLAGDNNLEYARKRIKIAEENLARDDYLSSLEHASAAYTLLSDNLDERKKAEDLIDKAAAGIVSQADSALKIYNFRKARTLVEGANKYVTGTNASDARAKLSNQLDHINRSEKDYRNRIGSIEKRINDAMFLESVSDLIGIYSFRSVNPEIERDLAPTIELFLKRFEQTIAKFIEDRRLKEAEFITKNISLSISNKDCPEIIKTLIVASSEKINQAKISYARIALNDSERKYEQALSMMSSRDVSVTMLRQLLNDARDAALASRSVHELPKAVALSAKSEFNLGRLYDAEKDFKKLVDNEEFRFDANLYLGIINLLRDLVNFTGVIPRETYMLARSYFERAMMVSHQGEPRATSFAYLMIAEGDLTAAVNAFTLALAINPLSSEAWCGRAIAFLLLNQAELASADCGRALRHQPNAFLPLFVSVSVEKFRGKIVEEPGQVRRLADLTDEPAFKKMYAMALLSRGEGNKAEKYLLDNMNDERSKEELMELLIGAYDQERKYQDIISKSSYFLDGGSYFGRAAPLIVRAFLSCSQLEEAQEAAQKFLANAERIFSQRQVTPDMLFDRSIILDMISQFDAAEKDLESAVNMSNDPLITFELAKMYVRHKKVSKGRKLLQELSLRHDEIGKQASALLGRIPEDEDY